MTRQPSGAAGAGQHGSVARWLRAVRRERRLSQRELAAKAQVPLSAITGIEGGRRSPGPELVERILTATGYRLTVVDVETGLPLLLVDDDTPRDRSGRRLPAHLSRDHDTAFTGRTFRQRPRQARGPLREHPWFGQFRGRNACHGPATDPCANCIGTCRYGSP